MIRTHGRRQIDTSKPLLKVEQSEDFFKKENEEAQESTIANGELKKKNTIETSNEPKKSDIIIPIAKQVVDPKLVADFDEGLCKKRKLQTHYIRINYIRPVPSPDVYEPTDRDLQFLKEINEKLPKPPRGSTAVSEVTMQTFQKTIETWENVTEKGDVVALAGASTLVESFYPGGLKEMVPKIYEHWKKLREEYKRPLLRKYLKVCNKDENNPNAAFRAREVNRIKTRRAPRMNDADNLEKMKNLKQDLEMVQTLMGNIKYREMLKLEHLELCNMKFETSTREKADTSANNKLVERFKESYENETYIKAKNKMKDYCKNAVSIMERVNAAAEEPLKEALYDKPIGLLTKSQSLKPTNTVAFSAVSTDEELKFDLGSFIASILDESISKDITPQKVSALDLPSVSEPTPMMIEPKAVEPNKDDLNLIPNPMIDIQRRTSSVQYPHVTQPMGPASIPVPVKPKQVQEDKNISTFRLQRRVGRQKRVLWDRLFEEDENSLTALPRDFYYASKAPKDSFITSEISSKLSNGNLMDLYMNRFGKLRDICPFNDSEEENDINESTKMIKNMGNNFKNFLKQRRPSNPIAGI